MFDISNLKLYLKTKPLDVEYNGVVDDKVSQELLNSVNQLEKEIKSKLPAFPALNSIHNNIKIIDNDKLSISIDELKSLVTKLHQTEDQNIKQIQSNINKNPFGIIYNGPTDGLSNKSLVDCLVNIENNIIQITGAQVKNKIVDNNQIVAKYEDLMKTFDLISEYKNSLNIQPK